MNKPNWTPTKVKLSEIKGWERNPRQSTRAQIKRLQKSEDEFGQPIPFLLMPKSDDGLYPLLDGHQRKSAWAEGEYHAMVVDRPLSEKEREKLVVTLHAGAKGQWDWNELSSWEFDDLTEWGMDEDFLDELNNDANNLKEMFAAEEPESQDAEPQIDRAAELQKKWRVKTGDLWQIGNHRLVCGDCTDAAVVERLMGGEKVDMVFTDPPYGVSYADKNDFLNSIDEGNRIQVEIENDHKTPGEMSIFWVDAFSTLRQFLRDGASYYVTSPQGGDLLLLLLLALKESEYPLRHMLIWAKNNHVLGRTDYNYKHEPILYGWVKGVHKFYAKHDVSLWEIDKPHASKLHPTMKPVELYERGIKNSTQKGEIVADIFAGSGTCLVASENLSRKCRAVEISENYCAVILERMSEAFPSLEIKRIESAK